MISPLFTTIVLSSAFIWIFMKNTTKHVGSGTEELLEKELRANSVRRQSLANLDYIDFNESSIPFISPAPSPRIDELYSKLMELSVCKIVNLTGISNTDLKLMYGPANLPDLTEYDQNFTMLARCLYDLGLELIAYDHTQEAVLVLNYAISIGTDISGNYISLANIYVENQNYDEIERLIAAADNIKSLTKQSTISKLQEIYDNHTTLVIEKPSADRDDSSAASSELIPDEILRLFDK